MTINTELPRKLRLKLLELYKKSNAGHIGCSLSCIDILTVLFFELKNEFEHVILSKGHAALALYVTLNEKGEISDDELNTFYKDGTKLPAHPSPNSFKSIPFALGSLGHGLPIGAGIAHANKILKNNARTFVVMSDGETNEGTTWEALHYAVANRLDNLYVFIDKNGLQGFGKTEDIFGDTANIDTLKAVGIDCIQTNGHDLNEIINKTNALNTQNGKPKAIICKTIKGKGVDFMENKMEWHYLPMSDELYADALESINRIYTNA